MSEYTDESYPQPMEPLEILPTVEANFEDPNFRLRENNTINNGISTLSPSKTKKEINSSVYEISQVNELGEVVPNGTAVISFLKPAYDATKKTHVYKRAINLSNSDQVSYNDLIFGKYIHYVSNPRGGQGLVDKSSYAVQTDVTISRTLRVATYSPY